MNPDLQDFLAKRLAFPGLAAWGLRQPDRAVTARSLAGWIKVPQIEQVLTRLALATDGLRSQQLDPVRLSWNFERLRLHLALRPDGACLALLVQNQSLPSPVSVPAILDEFTRL